MNGTAVARNDRSENSEEPESVQFMRLSPREREIICAVRELKFGELRVIFRDGLPDQIKMEISRKLGQPAV